MYIEPIPPLSSWDIRAACVHKKCLACLKSLLQVWCGAKFSFLSPGLKKKNCEKKFHRQPRLPAIVSSDPEVVFGFARSGFAHCQVQVVNAQQTVQPISQCRHFNFCQTLSAEEHVFDLEKWNIINLNLKVTIIERKMMSLLLQSVKNDFFSPGDLKHLWDSKFHLICSPTILRKWENYYYFFFFAFAVTVMAWSKTNQKKQTGFCTQCCTRLNMELSGNIWSVLINWCHSGLQHKK